MMEWTDESNTIEATTSADVMHDDNASDKEDDEFSEGVNDTCLLCEKPMEPSKSCVVRERAINSLIQASLKRNDKKHLKLKQLKEMTIHKTCQSMYTRDSNIKLALKQWTETWRNNRKRRKDGRAFDFSSKCLFCSNTLFHSSQVCRRVTKQITIDNIIAQLQVYAQTKINKVISSRVNVLKDNDDSYYIENDVSYHAKCLSLFYLYSPTNVKGKPISDGMTDLISFIINYLLENSDECQFSLKEILNKYTAVHGQTDFPRLDRIQQILKNHFQDEIVIHNTCNDRLICFKHSLGKCIEDSWYLNRENNEQEEKSRIVEMAAHIILQDIRTMTFNINNYNSPSDFLNNVTEHVPPTLRLFLDILIKTHKHTPKNDSWNKWENKITTAAHILMSMVRPQSFNSPILLGLSCMMHTKFSARGLIDCLHNIGLCASYSETVRFESSIVNDPDTFDLLSDTYLQFVYDNADHNTATIDGHNTFHCMGGIMCVTPSSSATFNSTIPRLKGVLPKASTTSGFTRLTDFQNNKPFTLSSVVVRDWKNTDSMNFSIKIEPIDLLYFYGKYTSPKSTPNWHGLMNTFNTHNTDYCTTRVIALPFIQAPPSNHSTILTALIDARQRANRNNQRHCFVTFDLPLYMKASEIVASIDAHNDPHNLQSVIPRLGGFHLAMSFLGAIGNIMTGSGLKEAFSTIYAELSADKALSGHAYSRSVRGHLLVQAALATIIFNKIQFEDDEKTFLDEGLEKMGEENFQTYLRNPAVKQIKEKFMATIDLLENKGPTSQLWVQYFKLICLLQRYIDAERSGDFESHIKIVQLMTPFFFASGHHLYAKACLLYIQQMLNLKESMDIVEFDKFCKKGFHTIRRSNRFWCGVWSDMTIEQVLMRAIKCSGGLTHGRGLTENVIGKWVLSRVAVLEVSNAMELFCNITFSSSEQHVDNRVSRKSRDAEDLMKVQQFFDTYDPFPETDKIVGIYSGVISDLKTVNCHRAYEIGKALMDNTSNKKFTDIKYKRNTKVVHLAAANSTIKNAANEEVYISSLLIFQKISLNIESQSDMKEYASSYELSPIPLSLFDENGMRKTTKSAFYSNFNAVYAIPLTAKITHIVDGGFLLHKVVWQNNINIDSIVSHYVSYALKHYAQNSYIIFDGYPEDEALGTKSVERSRRQMKNIGREIAFDKNTTIIVNQKQFLSNEKNKSRLIDFICVSLNDAGFRTKIAPEDADRAIVATAIENARLDTEATVVIVGEDVDLLVIFSQLANNVDNIYFRKEGKGAKPHEFYKSSSFKYENLQKIVALIHAFCGCDTTSCFYKLGKNKLIDSFSHDKLLQLSEVFYDEKASCEKISENAFEMIVGMYSNKAEKNLIQKSSSFSLSDLRYLHFSKAKVKTKFALETLPPTEGAAKQHAFRVFYQVQTWLGNENLKTTDWGWTIKNNHLVPVGTTDPPIPKKLLDQISCSCSKKGCIDTSCTCKKHGLRCTNLCAHCHEDTCYNLVINNDVIISEDDCTSEDERDDYMPIPNINFDTEEADCDEPVKKRIC